MHSKSWSGFILGSHTQGLAHPPINCSLQVPPSTKSTGSVMHPIKSCTKVINSNCTQLHESDRICCVTDNKSILIGDHVADVGLEGDGAEACNDWLDEEGTKTLLVQHVWHLQARGAHCCTTNPINHNGKEKRSYFERTMFAKVLGFICRLSFSSYMFIRNSIFCFTWILIHL